MEPNTQKKEEGSFGAMSAAIIFIVLLILAGLYFWNEWNAKITDQKNAAAAIQALEANFASSSGTVIEATTTATSTPELE